MRLFETILKLKKFPIHRAIIFYNKLSHLPSAEFMINQSQAKWEIAKHHLDYTPYYSSLLDNRLPSDWDKLPVLRKEDFQVQIDSLISRKYNKSNIYINNTSGSSGHPFYYVRDRFSHALIWAHAKASYFKHGIEYDAKQARFYGIPLLKGGLWRERLKDLLANRVRFTVFDLSDKVLEDFFKKFQAVAFHYIYGYTSSIVQFSRFLIKKGEVLSNHCPSLKGCIVTSEVLTIEDREILKKGLGLPIINEYGASELGIIAIDDIDGDWIINEELLFVEIVDENNMPVPDGIPGRVIITALYNKAMPIIRYEIGDYGVISKKRKNNHRVFSQLLGRVNDFALLPSGKRSPGLTFYYISRSLMEKSGGMSEFIIKQKSINSFEFEYVAKEELSTKQKKQVQEMMDLYLEPGLLPIFTKKDKIDRPASGKLKHFYSELGTQKK